MVAFTPNRGYPYSTPTDPADIPAAIQSLAEAIDLDMQALDDSITGRPLAQVSWSAPVGTYQLFPANQTTECEFNFVEADNADISDLSAQPSRLTPTSAGLWLVWGSIGVPNGAGTLGTSIRDIFIRMNGIDLTRSGYESMDPTSAIRGMTLAGMAVMDGVDDYFTMTLTPNGALDDLKVRLLKFACMRITNT